jgi:hypothetical protein
LRHCIEASTSKIGEDQLFYFQQRGIDPESAVGIIISGFCNEAGWTLRTTPRLKLNLPSSSSAPLYEEVIENKHPTDVECPPPPLPRVCMWESLRTSARPTFNLLLLLLCAYL